MRVSARSPDSIPVSRLFYCIILSHFLKSRVQFVCSYQKNNRIKRARCCGCDIPVPGIRFGGLADPHAAGIRQRGLDMYRSVYDVLSLQSGDLSAPHGAECGQKYRNLHICSAGGADQLLHFLFRGNVDIRSFLFRQRHMKDAGGIVDADHGLDRIKNIDHCLCGFACRSVSFFVSAVKDRRFLVFLSYAWALHEPDGNLVAFIHFPFRNKKAPHIEMLNK